MREQIDQLWDEQWPTTPPVGHLLRNQERERWVRFHTLPESKRYPDTEDEYEIVLSRHHALLAALGLRGPCFVVTTVFADESLPPPHPAEVPLPRAVHWCTLPPSYGEDMEMAIYASESRHPSAELDRLIRGVVDEEVWQLIIVPPSGRWLYHPYDGGADVIAETKAARDGLQGRFADWLSPYPGGL